MPTQRALVLSLALFALPALAVEPELAAENYLTEVNSNTHVGGAASVRFAQVFEVFDTGPLSHLMLPVGCDPGATLVVTIEEAPGGQPGGSVLARQNVPGHALDAVQWGNTVAAMRMVEFTRPAVLTPGLYAFTLARRGKGDCGLWRAPAGSAYAHYAFTAWTGNPAGWQVLRDAKDRPQFLAFQAYQRPL